MYTECCENCKSFKLIVNKGQKICTECGLVFEHQEQVFSTFESREVHMETQIHDDRLQSISDILQLNDTEMRIVEDLFENTHDSTKREEILFKMAGIVYQHIPRFTIQDLETKLNIKGKSILKYSQHFDCSYNRLAKLRAIYFKVGQLLNYNRKELYKNLKVLNRYCEIEYSDFYIIWAIFYKHFDVSIKTLRTHFPKCQKNALIKCLKMIQLI